MDFRFLELIEGSDLGIKIVRPTQVVFAHSYPQIVQRLTNVT